MHGTHDSKLGSIMETLDGRIMQIQVTEAWEADVTLERHQRKNGRLTSVPVAPARPVPQEATLAVLGETKRALAPRPARPPGMTNPSEAARAVWGQAKVCTMKRAGKRSRGAHRMLRAEQP